MTFSTLYRTEENNPVDDFYAPCLDRAIRYRRAVGYFRSTVFDIIGENVVSFARRGGVIQIICSPAMTPWDIKTVEDAYEYRKAAEVAIFAELDKLVADPITAYPTRVLATLIAVGCLDLRLALRPRNSGIYHEKLGLFDDANGDRVSFKGSANESYSGWHEHGTFESIDVFCSWEEGKESQRVSENDRYFDRLWESRIAGLEVLPLTETARDRLIIQSIGGLDDIDEALLSSSKSTRRKLFKHQSDALRAWVAQNRRGILEHATGSGKTLTALTAIRMHIAEGNPALVLVPSKLLLEQWEREIRSEIPEASILLAGAKNNKWREGRLLEAMTSPGVNEQRVVLATMRTACSNRFVRDIVGGPHLLIVADEVHQVGSVTNSKSLAIPSGPRLGLSATPKRFGDPEGTENILAYFGDVVPPPFTLNDAILTGRLVPYEYHPYPIALSSDETIGWNKLSDKILHEMARSGDDGTGTRLLSERAKMLLIQRSRIAKKACAKLSLALTVVKTHYRLGQRWLVYCEDAAQLSDILASFRNAGLEVFEYHSNMTSDRDAVMTWFEDFGGILVSIRCLDEGVDIPAVSHALILASSQNPRQFIQRRGRVLRRYPGKTHAEIHDAIVVPPDLASEPRQAPLVRAEFKRAIEFADNSLNLGAGTRLKIIASDIGFDVADLDELGIEDDMLETED